MRTLVVLGSLNGLESLIEISRRGTLLKGLTSLSLVYLLAPLLLFYPQRWLRWLGFMLCAIEVLRGGLAFVGSIAAMVFDPIMFTVYLFGTPVWELRHPGSQFVYFFFRGAVFGACGLALLMDTREPNKTPEPTPTAVTPPAAQEPRQP